MNKQLDSRLARKWAQRFTNQAYGSRRSANNELLASARHTLKNAARILAPSFFMVVFAVAAHAQGAPASVDFSGVTTVGTSIVGILKFVGAGMAIGGLIFSAFEWFGRHDVGKAVGGVVGALVGAIIIGAATAWGTSTAGAMSTGQ